MDTEAQVGKRSLSDYNFIVEHRNDGTITYKASMPMPSWFNDLDQYEQQDFVLKLKKDMQQYFLNQVYQQLNALQFKSLCQDMDTGQMDIYDYD